MLLIGIQKTYMTTNPFEVYKTYVALKLHFQSKSYDFFKFQGKSRATHNSFERRSDKAFFYRLAKRKDYLHFLLANLVNDSFWIGELVHNEEAEKTYKKWKKTIESLTYIFKEDLKHIPGLLEAIRCDNGQHPQLLTLYLGNQISLETVVIITQCTKCLGHWNQYLQDDPIWDQYRFRIEKYTPFLGLNLSVFRTILKDRYEISKSLNTIT